MFAFSSAAAMGISPSSLYAAFGDKKSLFSEAVLSYARRYAAIYAEAATAPTARETAERVLRASADEFTDETRPMGCLTVSAAMTGGADTIDVRETLRALQSANAAILRDKIRDDVAAGRLPADTDPGLLTDWVQTVWEGLSNQSNNGVRRERLHRIITQALRAW